MILHHSKQVPAANLNQSQAETEASESTNESKKNILTMRSFRSSNVIISTLLVLWCSAPFVASQDNTTAPTMAPTNATNATAAPINATVAPTAAPTNATVAPTNATMAPTLAINVTDAPTMMPTNMTNITDTNTTMMPMNMTNMTDAPTPAATEPATPAPTKVAVVDEPLVGSPDEDKEVGTCGLGVFGNGICFDQRLCCSDLGNCFATCAEARADGAYSTSISMMVVAAAVSTVMLF